MASSDKIVSSDGVLKVDTTMFLTEEEFDKWITVFKRNIQSMEVEAVISQNKE